MLPCYKKVVGNISQCLMTFKKVKDSEKKIRYFNKKII